jgi:outer membrane receptor protein involved in Fe transport
MFRRIYWVLALIAIAVPSFAQTGTGRVIGRVTDETGAALPGVTVELRGSSGNTAATRTTVSGGMGEYAFDGVSPGSYQVNFTLINFASATHRDLTVTAGATATDNEVLHLSLNAEVVVIGKRTFTNLADAADPAEDLVGIAQSASQGAITAKQLDVRPFMRQGEVLETVPGVIITQHSGEGKANQYFLRGFNLDHGSDFAMTVAGAPVNMVTHAHSQGYSDLNFLMSELVAGVQYSKGPYYADSGDFATAGSSNINYATELERPIARVEGGGFGFARGMFAASPKLGSGHLLAAFETSKNNGPWVNPDDYRKLNGVLRYSQGDNVNGMSLTAMAYHGEWNATQASPQRAVDEGLITRFGTIDPTDRGRTHRYSIAGEWQHGTGTTLNKIQAYGIDYSLNLFNNFTFYLDDPIHGDQNEQVDRRFVSGVKAFQKRLSRWGDRSVQNTFGVQVRNDDIGTVALYHTERRERLFTRTDDSAMVTTAGIYGESQIEWAPWLRTTAGLRIDGSHYKVTDKIQSINSGTSNAAIVSPKGAVTLGPWKGTEMYVNAGTGFHSNDARGTTIVVLPDGSPADRVTPLVRAKGAEVGVRTVVVPHLQSTVSLWTLRLGSELVYDGDAGATEPGPASKRYGVEFANYYSPKPWLVFDGDYSWSRARFSAFNEAGPYVPEAVDTVISGGASIDNLHKTFASLRLRYFGPRPLIEDNSVRSKATTLVNLEAGYQLLPGLRVNLEVFNLANESVSDIDYYFASRLPGEPLSGIEGIHTHPAVPRTARVSMIIGF